MMKTNVCLPARLQLRQTYKKTQYCSHVYACVIAVPTFCVPLCLLLKPEVIIKLH